MRADPEDFLIEIKNPRKKEIADCPGYWIYENGLVWSDKSNKFLPWKWRYGRNQKNTDRSFTERGDYLKVSIGRIGERYIHRLLAQAFIPNPNNYPYVDHLNGIKHDNRLENLRWVTPSQNLLHQFNTGLQQGIPMTEEMKKKQSQKMREGYTKGRLKKFCTEVVVLTQFGEFVEEHASVIDCAQRYGVPTSLIVSATHRPHNCTLSYRKAKKEEMRGICIPYRFMTKKEYTENPNKWKIPEGFYRTKELMDKYLLNPQTLVIINAWTYRKVKTTTMNRKPNNGYMLKTYTNRGYTLKALTEMEVMK